MFLLLTFAFACSGGQARVDEILALTGDATAGADLYDSTCASCHAADGSGGTGPNIQGYSSASEAAEVVLYGEDEMPAYDGDLDDQEIADVVAFVTEVL